MTQPCLLPFNAAGEKPDIWRVVGALCADLPVLPVFLAEHQNELAQRVHFSPDAFGLNEVDLFALANAQTQLAILQACSHSVLSEAYAIELSGMFFASKMTQNAKTMGERILYSQFSAQESEHYLMLWGLLGTHPTGLETNPFPSMLAQAIVQGSAPSLVFLIQVVLEGWGIQHYRHLHAHALSAETKAVFKKILQDEVHHHGSGVSLCAWQDMSAADHEFVVVVLRQLLNMVRVGPQSVLAALSANTPLRTHAEVCQVLVQLRHLETSGQKLGQLRRLMQLSANTSLLNSLAAEGFFEPFSVEQAAEFHVQSTQIKLDKQDVQSTQGPLPANPEDAANLDTNSNALGRVTHAP